MTTHTRTTIIFYRNVSTAIQWVNEDSAFNIFAIEYSLSNVEVNLPCLWYSELVNHARMEARPQRICTAETVASIIDFSSREEHLPCLQSTAMSGDNVVQFNDMELGDIPLYSPQFMSSMDTMIDRHYIEMEEQERTLQRSLQGHRVKSDKHSSIVGHIHKYLALVDDLPSFHEFCDGKLNNDGHSTNANTGGAEDCDTVISDSFEEELSQDVDETSKKDWRVIDSLDSFMALKNNRNKATAVVTNNIDKTKKEQHILPIPGFTHSKSQEDSVSQLLRRSSIFSCPGSLFPARVTSLLLYNILHKTSNTIVWVAKSAKVIEEEYELQSHVLSGFARIRLVRRQNLIDSKYIAHCTRARA